MQDKDIDVIFRLKLDAFEVEPSAGMWPRIAAQIDLTKRKKTWVPYLGAAASVVILLTAGIFFIPQKVNKAGKRNLVSSMVKAPITSPAVKREDILKRIDTNTLTGKIVLRHDKKHDLVGAERTSPAAEITDTGKAVRPVIAVVPYREKVIEPVVPDIATQLAIKQSITEIPDFGIKPNIVSAQLPARDIEHAGQVKTRHKIRGPGDLINAVVEKVDKRHDKIIEFTDDDDETNVTGINLGIIKIKKEK